MKDSTKTSHHCDRPPERSILRQLQGLGCCDIRVVADLVNPGGGWPTTGMTPFLRWPLTFSRLGAYSKNLIGWYGARESGNVAKKIESLFANNEQILFTHSLIALDV